jgi:hypothetical protein
MPLMPLVPTKLFLQKCCEYSKELYIWSQKQTKKAMKTKSQTIDFINKKIKEGFSGREVLDLTNKFRNGDFDEPNVPSDLVITKDKNGFPTIELR